MANNIISRLRVSLGLDNSKFKSGLKESEKQTKGFGETMNKIGTQIAAVFGVREIARFTAEVVKLAGEAEGVQRAFNRIGGQAIMNDIRNATRGTVSELELMRKAVSAQQLGVPIENLSKLFEFATARAADTGESVDFLVSSIVTGIGRKSPLILDNLGISAIALREKMEGVGLGTASVGQVAEAVGKIAEEELNKIGNAATTNGQKIQSFAATWDNLRLTIGRVVTQTNEFGFGIAILDKFNALLSGQRKEASEAEKGAKRLFDIWKESGRLTPDFIKRQTDLLRQQRKDLLLNRQENSKGTKERIQQIGILLGLLGKQKKAQEDNNKKTVEEVRNIETLSKKIEALKTDQQTTTGSRLADINKEIAALEKEIKTLKGLGVVIARLPEIEPIKISDITGKLEIPEIEQRIQQDPPELPIKLTPEGAFAETEEFKKLQFGTQIAADQQIAQNALEATQNSMMAYGSIVGSVGQITQAFGDSTIGTFAGVAAQVISSVAQMLPALFGQSIASATASGAALPFPANLAAIAAGIAGVVSAFSGIGGGGAASAGAGASRTSIDTRRFQTPTTTGGTTRTTTQQTVRVEIEGKIKGKDIALANKQGETQIRQ